MLSALIHKAHLLQDVEPKQSFHIAKELAIIELNLLWYPDKFDDHMARMRSLAQHVLVTFKDSDKAKELAVLIRHKALLLESHPHFN